MALSNRYIFFFSHSVFFSMSKNMSSAESVLYLDLYPLPRSGRSFYVFEG